MTNELWSEWPDRVRMSVIAMHRHWFLFDQKGKPHVVKRRKVREGDKEYADEETCDLFGSDPSMTKDARDFLQIAWGEHTNWRKANKETTK